MARFTAAIILLASQLLRPIYSLHADEAGLNDFLLASSGHGRVTKALFIHNNDLIVTASPENSCYVAARNIQSGDLVWRLNACSNEALSLKDVGISASGDSLIVVDDGVIVKSIDAMTGNVIVDEQSGRSSRVKTRNKAQVMNEVKILSKLNQIDSAYHYGAAGVCVPSAGNVDDPSLIALATTIRDDGNVELHVYEFDRQDNASLTRKDLLDLNVSTNGEVLDIFASCEDNAKRVSALISTSGGTSAMIIPIDASLPTPASWTHEETITSLKTVQFFDRDFATVEDSLHYSFKERYRLQMMGALSFFGKMKARVLGGKSTISHGRDADFGFGKVAVALSESNTSQHRVFGIDTLNKGKIVWSLLLNEGTTKSYLVKDQLSPSTSRHKSELLVVSELKDGKGVEWKCVNGITGFILEEGVADCHISKIFPLGVLSNEKHCRQVLLTIDEEENVTVLPSTEGAFTAANAELSREPFYLHSIDHERGSFKSLRVDDQNKEGKHFQTTIVGEANIPEKIVDVAYALSEEKIQSPVTIMGDDSLLLKYLNPHLAVVISEGREESIESFEKGTLPFASAEASSASSKKPLGASKPGEVVHDSSIISAPSVFVTLIDTVSARVLYRISHSDAAVCSQERDANVPIIVSENWIYYSFWNQRAKRSEIGVLSLYDGMIEKYGMTAFKSPAQDTSFSSFEAPKPIVLHKTFSMGKRIVSMGITQTTLGMSSKNVLFGFENGQIYALERVFLDPRRPSSEPTVSEKAERLSR